MHILKKKKKTNETKQRIDTDENINVMCVGMQINIYFSQMKTTKKIAP